MRVQAGSPPHRSHTIGTHGSSVPLKRTAVSLRSITLVGQISTHLSHAVHFSTISSTAPVVSCHFRAPVGHTSRHFLHSVQNITLCWPNFTGSMCSRARCVLNAPLSCAPTQAVTHNWQPVHLLAAAFRRR